MRLDVPVEVMEADLVAERVKVREREEVLVEDKDWEMLRERDKERLGFSMAMVGVWQISPGVWS